MRPPAAAGRRPNRSGAFFRALTLASLAGGGLLGAALSAPALAQELPADTTPLAPGQSPSPKPNPGGAPRVKVRADSLRSDRQSGVTTFRGNVRVDYGETGVDAEELSVNQNTQEIYTDTRFTLTQPDSKNPGKLQIITGTGLRYNYETQEATVFGGNASLPAQAADQTVYVRAKQIKAYGQERFIATDATFSTCNELVDERTPHYHVEAKSLEYYANDKVVGWDNRVYLNGRFVGWLPVWVYPLKGEKNNLDVGRSNIEGFYLRSGYNYALPAMNNGFWLNDGRLIANLFERKGLGLGAEHNARWGYDAATYAFFYGLLQPDNGNLLPVGTKLTPLQEAQLLQRNRTLFGLGGLPFQDHQLGIEHKQRLPGGIEVDGRFEDHNIYDPLTENYRVNRQILRLSLKDSIEALGNLAYDASLDSSVNRAVTVPVDPNNLSAQVTENLADQVRGNASFKVGNTDVRLNNQTSRTGTRQRVVTAPSALPTDPAAEVPYGVEVYPGNATTTITNTLNASSNWGPDTTSTLAVPQRLVLNEVNPAPPQPGATPLPTPTPSPWSNQVEPTLEVNHRLAGLGTLNLSAQKFFEFTEQNPAQTPAEESARLRALNKFDKLPELTFTSDPIWPQGQPFNVKMAYGRFFEYASIPEDLGALVNQSWPGLYVNRFNPELTLASKAHDIGLRSHLDFGQTGYRQFFYSTGDAQYALDERVRLTTDWTPQIQTNFNYTNNLTPVAKDANDRFVNNSPFQQDKIALSKVTRLTGDFNVNAAPYFTYALRSGYDYQNLLYDNISSEVTWRNRLWGLGLPFALTLNGTYDIADEPYLKLERKTFQLGALPIPTYGIAGTWLPVAGTFSLRSTPGVYGGAFGSEHIEPGWQFDTSVNYDFDKGQISQLGNRLHLILGTDWRSHVEFTLGGYYDITSKRYDLAQFGITKDLHDFALSFYYDRLQSSIALNLTMLAFPSQPVGFNSNTFNRRVGAGGAGFGGF